MGYARAMADASSGTVSGRTSRERTRSCAMRSCQRRLRPLPEGAEELGHFHRGRRRGRIPYVQEWKKPITKGKAENEQSSCTKESLSRTSCLRGPARARAPTAASLQTRPGPAKLITGRKKKGDLAQNLRVRICSNCSDPNLGNALIARCGSRQRRSRSWATLLD